MALPFRRAGLIFNTLLLLAALQACEKKEPRESGAAADAAGQTRPYMTTEEVKVRSGPGTRYKIIAAIKSGYKVNVAGRESGWLKVVSNQGNPPGYIDERFAKPMAVEPSARSITPTPGDYITTADAYVREGPGLHYKAVAKIEKDMQVTVVGGDGDWLKVQSKHGRPPGYIEKKYTEREPN